MVVNEWDTKYHFGSIKKFHEEWEQMFQEGHKISSSPILSEFKWKIKVRFFRSPFITSKFSGTSD